MTEVANLDAIAAEAFAMLGTAKQIAPFSTRYPDLDLNQGYSVTAKVRGLREEAGEVARGRKIGFTNRTIWPEYGVYAPIWGYVYDRTVHDLENIQETFSLAGLSEPKIEPEIIFGLSAAPAPGMDARALLSCIGWVAQGFEVVASIFPGWQFKAPDAVSAFGLHGALLIGRRHSPRDAEDAWVSALASFEIDLLRDGERADHGAGRNVLESPLLALRHLVDVLAQDRANPPLATGEVVTTGTLTRALPIQAGEVWSTQLSGVALDGARVRFT